MMTNLIAQFYGKYLKQYAKGKLLDLGCGNVPLYQAYKDLVVDNICVDWENTYYKNDYLDFECDLTKKLPFKDASFDTIILSDVLEHVPNPFDLLSESQRILSKDGVIIMNVPFLYWIHEEPYDYYRYTEYIIKKMMDDLNLKSLVLKPIGGAPEVLTDIFSRIVVKIFIIGPLTVKFIQYFNKVFLKTKLGIKVSKNTAKNFPLGYFIVARK